MLELRTYAGEERLALAVDFSQRTEIADEGQTLVNGEIITEVGIVSEAYVNTENSLIQFELSTPIAGNYGVTIIADTSGGARLIEVIRVTVVPTNL